MWSPASSLTVGLVVTGVVMVISQMDPNNKDFQLLRLTDMDDKMPPFNPLSPIERKTDCAMLCVDDVTCAGFSYSEMLRFCMMTPEAVRPYDVSISLNLNGFVYFNVFEDLRKSLLPPGYRTFSIPDLALRFHYYLPLSWTGARDSCETEGGRLLTLDTEAKRLLLQDIVLDNKALNVSGLGLYVGGHNNGTDFYWQTGSLLPDTDPLWSASGPTGSGNCTLLERDAGFHLVDFNCTLERPYVCEHLYFETEDTFVGFTTLS